jgi:hypothetical protein
MSSSMSQVRVPDAESGRVQLHYLAAVSKPAITI